MTNIKFTGEYYVPGAASDRLEADHMARYFFASQYVLGKKVLDVACGEGYGSNVLLDAGAHSYIGIDINEKLVVAAKSKYSSNKAEFKVGDIANLKLKDSYDVIVCFETIEHISFYRKALTELRKHLSPSGILIISSPNRPVTSPKATSVNSTPKNPYHTQEFTPDELIGLLIEAGFNANKFEIYGQRLSLFYFKNFFLRVIQRVFGLDPSFRSSPEVKLFKYKTPRYFLILARS